MSIVVNFNEFKNQVESEGKEATQAIALAIKRLVFDIFRNTVSRTPVDTGNLRASWGLSIDSAGSHIVNNGGSASQALQQLLPFRNYKEIPDTWFIYNNQDYASKIENGGSKQAPQGMLRIGTQEAVSNFEIWARTV